MWLANDGNYRELRWFTTWKEKEQLVDFLLPPEISEVLSQRTVPFGYGYIQFLDTYVTPFVFFAPPPPLPQPKPIWVLQPPSPKFL